jgi:hypothetical protein
MQLRSHRPAPRSLVACAVLLVALFATGCGLGAVDKAAEAFMADLKAGSYAQAFARETPTMQQKFGGSAQAMEAQIKKWDQQPTDWSFNKISISNGVGRVHGSATFVDGKKGAVDMELLDQDGRWFVAAVSFAK